MNQGENKKKQIWIYIAVAYGVTYLMGLFMWYGYRKGVTVGLFPNAQMLYPAAGVMLAYLRTRKYDIQMPRRFFITFLVVTAIMIVCAAGSVFVPGNITFSLSVWDMIGQMVLLIGSILFWIMLLTERKEKRAAYGLRWCKGKMSVLMILLFLGLYLFRAVLAYAMEGNLQAAAEIAANPMTWIMLINIFFAFFISIVAFFGEEYGWRYYLQPLLQNRFGKRWGVIILGIVWGLWHMPVNFFYYSAPGAGLASMAAQQITCITLGIFFAYAYMKTNNIWVPVILHFLNNNMVLIVSGSYDASVIQNQTITWISLIPALLVNGILFGGFLFSKVFRKEKENTEAKLPKM